MWLLATGGTYVLLNLLPLVFVRNSLSSKVCDLFSPAESVCFLRPHEKSHLKRQAYRLTVVQSSKSTDTLHFHM